MINLPAFSSELLLSPPPCSIIPSFVHCKLRSVEDLCCLFAAVLAFLITLLPAGVAQQASSKHLGGVTIQGTVLSVDGKPMSDATVSLEKKGSSDTVETKTNAAGAFVFSALSTGSYRLSAEKSGPHSRTADVVASSENDMEKVDLILEGAGSAADSGASSAHGAQTMEFSDQPNFTVAGVTDWTAVGGHGSDSTLRTSESLASETAALKAESVGHGAATAVERRQAKEIGEQTACGTRQRSRQLRCKPSRSANFISMPDGIRKRFRCWRALIGLIRRNEGNRYDLALAYEGGGDVARARVRIRELLAKQQSADLHRLMGELDEKAGDPLSAVHEYEQAVKLSPSEQNYFEWGSELLLHRAVWQAQEVFRKGADAYPKSARMQTALGTALFAGCSLR